MYSVRHSDGSGDDGPDDFPGQEAALSDLFDELLTADQEHGDVSITHEESGWCISAHRGGTVIIECLADEHLDEGIPRHMAGVTKARTLGLWRKLIAGDMASLEAEPWKPGYF